jgi:hypothetical protein
MRPLMAAGVTGRIPRTLAFKPLHQAALKPGLHPLSINLARYSLNPPFD